MPKVSRAPQHGTIVLARSGRMGNTPRSIVLFISR